MKAESGSGETGARRFANTLNYAAINRTGSSIPLRVKKLPGLATSTRGAVYETIDHLMAI
jgi:hypothetical protein